MTSAALDPKKVAMVTQIEKGSVQGKSSGNFVQSTDTEWIEQNENRLTLFKFREQFRDASSIHLFDPSRDVNLIIDLNQNVVRIRDSRQPDFIDLQSITGTSTAPALYVFRSLTDYNFWYSGGGEQRAGLPHQSMLELHQHILGFRGQLNQAAVTLISLQNSWSRIESSQSAMTDALINKLIPDLSALSAQTQILVSSALGGSILVEKANTLVNAHLEEDRQQLTKAFEAKQRAEEGMRLAQISLAAAKAELRGDRGFLNGFLTGITFSAYNPVQENINRANRAINDYNANLVMAQTAIVTSQRTQAELTEETRTLSQLAFLRSAFVSFQNQLSEAQNALARGYNSAEKTLKAQNNTLGEYYREQAGQQMRQLFGWADSFRAAN